MPQTVTNCSIKRKDEVNGAAKTLENIETLAKELTNRPVSASIKNTVKKLHEQRSRLKKRFNTNEEKIKDNGYASHDGNDIEENREADAKMILSNNYSETQDADTERKDNMEHSATNQDFITMNNGLELNTENKMIESALVIDTEENNTTGGKNSSYKFMVWIFSLVIFVTVALFIIYSQKRV